MMFLNETTSWSITLESIIVLLESSIKHLESSVTLLENIYSTNVTYDHHMMIVTCLQATGDKYVAASSPVWTPLNELLPLTILNLLITDFYYI